MHNPYSDPNPYEAPVQAQLAQPEPRPNKWVPYGSFVVTIFGPVIFLILLRYSIHTWKILEMNSPVELAIDGTAGVVWIICLVRSLWWIAVRSWR